MSHRDLYGSCVTPSGLAMLEVGQKTVAAAATPEVLTTALPCTLVWVGAPYNKATGAPTNTKPVQIGLASGQFLPIMPTDFEGVFVPCLNSNSILVDVGVNGEDLNYVVFG